MSMGDLEGVAGRRAAELDGPDSLTVASVARMIGVAPSTLRTWARRYGVEPSGHRTGLHRRYSEADLARLRYMRALTQAGMTSRDAAERAMNATPDDLVLSPVAARRFGGAEDALGDDVVTPMAGVGVGRRQRHDLWSVTPAVRAVLATAAGGDARGCSALLRTAVRDLGAARTWDERVSPARAALWRTGPTVEGRAAQVLDRSMLDALSTPRPVTRARNAMPVHVVGVPGHEDAVALGLLGLALAERMIRVEPLPLGLTLASATRALSEAAGACVLVHVADDPVAAQAAGRLRLAGARDQQVHWGDGWLRWPGQAGSMVDLTRLVEKVVCSTSG